MTPQEAAEAYAVEDAKMYFIGSIIDLRKEGFLAGFTHAQSDPETMSRFLHEQRIAQMQSKIEALEAKINQRQRRNIRYKSLPLMIEAFRYNVDLKPAWFMSKIVSLEVVATEDSCLIRTPDGTMRALKGDYIIKDLIGELYPCKQEAFHKKYESVYE